MARRRHFPAIHWTRSYTLYQLGNWFGEHVAPSWQDTQEWALALLQKEVELLDIVQLVGADALAPEERAILVTGRLIREDFLQQSAFDEIEAFCPLPMQYQMLKVIRHFHEVMKSAVRRGVALEQVSEAKVLTPIARMRNWNPETAEEEASSLCNRIDQEIGQL